MFYLQKNVYIDKVNNSNYTIVDWLVATVINHATLIWLSNIIKFKEEEMFFEEESLKPIYIQVSEWIEDEILKGHIQEEEQVISTNQFASMYKINPATAGKGLNLLVNENILYKKRGIGMFVAVGAKKIIINKRKENFYSEYIEKIIYESQKLGISREELIQMIKDK